MPKLSKNYIVIIVLSVISLILGGTFFAIFQNNSKQGSAQNSTNPSSVSNSSQISPTSQSSSSGFSSISSSNSQNSSSFSSSQANSSNTKIQPLVADKDYDVVVSEQCDLAVKYSKLSSANHYDNGSNNLNLVNPPSKSLIGLNIAPDYNFSIGVRTPFGLVGSLNFECYNRLLSYEDFINMSYKNIGKRIPENQMIIENPSSVDAFCKDVGLLESSCKLVTKVVKMKNKYSSDDDSSYFIDVKINSIERSYYIVDYANNANIQFNSLAPSTPSVKLEDSNNSQKTNLQTYTNEYYPSLKINYDNSWKMETITSPVKYNPDRIGLLAREINLTKSGANLKINLYLEGGFGGGGDMEIQGTKIRENLYRYGPINNFEYDYISHSTTTNARSGPTYILSSSLKDLKNQPVNADVVILANLGNYNGDKNQILAEIDNILKNSSFGEPLR